MADSTAPATSPASNVVGSSNEYRGWRGNGRGWFSLNDFLGLGASLLREVSAGDALQQAAVFCCLDVLAQDTGKAPIRLKKRTRGKGGHVGAQTMLPEEHPVAALLWLRPNRHMTWPELVEMTVWHLGFVNNAYPMLRMILSEQIIESTLSKWADYGINATAGAAKGKTLDVDVGSEALANMLRRGQERASASNVSAWVMKAGGGPEEVAKKLFRKLTLDETASGADVLPKALEKAGVGPVAASPEHFPPPTADELRDAERMSRN